MTRSELKRMTESHRKLVGQVKACISRLDNPYEYLITDVVEGDELTGSDTVLQVYACKRPPFDQIEEDQ